MQYIRLLLFLFDCLPPVNIWLPLLYMQVIDVFSVRENVECNCSWKRDLFLYDGCDGPRTRATVVPRNLKEFVLIAYTYTILIASLSRTIKYQDLI